MIPQSVRAMPASTVPTGRATQTTGTRPPRAEDAITIDKIDVDTFTVPTEVAESDGTHEWNSTTMVVVHVHAGGQTGLGYTYSHKAAAVVIHEVLSPLIVGGKPTAIPELQLSMQRALRNVGTQGIGAAAISAVDNALWDLKARLLGIPLVALLGQARSEILIYGSGGFTSYEDTKLARQLEGWVREGIKAVKMKVGRDPERDVQRVELARQVIGDDVELMVDANGAYSRKQALRMAQEFAAQGVTWLEEPVSSDDLRGLQFLRGSAPSGMEITAGEYGYDASYFRRMMSSGAIDVVQPDVTRCMGISGFLGVCAMAQAWNLPVSAHTAPAQSLHVCCAAGPVRHIEWFHDHVRIERMLFDGFPKIERGGAARPNLDSPGNGLTLRRSDADQYRVR